MSVLEWFVTIALLPHIIGAVITALTLLTVCGAAGYIAFAEWRDARARLRRRRDR